MHVIRRLGAPTVIQAPSVKIFRPVDSTSSSASIYAGQFDRTAGQDVQQTAIVRQPTPPPPPPAAPPPTAVPGACDNLYAQLMSAAQPHVRTCLNTKPYHRTAFNELCKAIATGQTTLPSGAAQWANYVSQQCPTPTAPPPTPPPPPTGQPTIPDLPPDTGGPVDLPGGGPSDAPQEDTSRGLRQLGSVVGIGLLMAVGLTYARKKGMLKLTKRRRRR